MYGLHQRFQILSMAFCLLFMLTACSQSVNNTTTSHSSNRPEPTATATATPTEARQTCPAPATARAAVMSPMPVGKHSNLVYLAQSDKNDTLLRYDMTTASSTTLLQTKAIEKANISPDGQWILLIAEVQGRSALQLIRIDGQQLQTLYCAPSQDDIISALLSPDQHFLLFSQRITQQDNSGREYDSDSLYLLDMATAKLQVDVAKFSPDAAQSSSTSSVVAQQRPQQATSPLLTSASFMDKSLNDQPLHPSNAQFPNAGNVTLGFNLWRWANAYSVYLTDFTIPALIPGGPGSLYLLHDIRKNVSWQKSNIQPIGYTPDKGLCTYYDVTPDNEQFVCSHNAYLGNPDLPATIELQPLAGGAIHTIYHDPGGVVNVHPLSNSILLFTRWHPDSPETLWKINIDGSGATQLMTAPPKDDGDWFRFPDDGQPWSLASRDGQNYVLQTDGGVLSDGTMTGGMIIGSLSESKTKARVIQQKGSEFVPVGWSQV